MTTPGPGPGPASLAVVPVPTGSASRGRPLLENERPGKIRVGQALPVSVVSCDSEPAALSARKGGRVQLDEQAAG